MSARLASTSTASRFASRERATIRATRRVDDQDDVRCAIPGYEEDGFELYAEELAVRDDPYDYALTGKCAYRSLFHYSG